MTSKPPRPNNTAGTAPFLNSPRGIRNIAKGWHEVPTLVGGRTHNEFYPKGVAFGLARRSWNSTPFHRGFRAGLLKHLHKESGPYCLVITVRVIGYLASRSCPVFLFSSHPARLTHGDKINLFDGPKAQPITARANTLGT